MYEPVWNNYYLQAQPTFQVSHVLVNLCLPTCERHLLAFIGSEPESSQSRGTSKPQPQTPPRLDIAWLWLIGRSIFPTKTMCILINSKYKLRWI